MSYYLPFDWWIVAKITRYSFVIYHVNHTDHRFETIQIAISISVMCGGVKMITTDKNKMRKKKLHDSINSIQDPPKSFEINVFCSFYECFRIQSSHAYKNKFLFYFALKLSESEIDIFGVL